MLNSINNATVVHKNKRGKSRGDECVTYLSIAEHTNPPNIKIITETIGEQRILKL